jgi:hypothetical protein
MKKKNTLPVVDGDQRVDNNSYVKCNMPYTLLQREIALSSVNPKEEREMIELFNINI